MNGCTSGCDGSAGCACNGGCASGKCGCAPGPRAAAGVRPPTASERRFGKRGKVTAQVRQARFPGDPNLGFQAPMATAMQAPGLDPMPMPPAPSVAMPKLGLDPLPLASGDAHGQVERAVDDARAAYPTATQWLARMGMTCAQWREATEVGRRAAFRLAYDARQLESGEAPLFAPGFAPTTPEHRARLLDAQARLATRVAAITLACGGRGFARDRREPTAAEWLAIMGLDGGGPRASGQVVAMTGSGTWVVTNADGTSQTFPTRAEADAYRDDYARVAALKATGAPGTTPADVASADARLAADTTTRTEAIRGVAGLLHETFETIRTAMTTGSATERARIQNATSLALGRMLDAEGRPLPGSNPNDIALLLAMRDRVGDSSGSSGMSDATKTALVVGGVVVGATILGVAAYYLSKPTPAYRGNPAKDAFTGRFATKRESRRADGRFAPGYQHAGRF